MSVSWTADLRALIRYSSESRFLSMAESSELGIQKLSEEMMESLGQSLV